MGLLSKWPVSSPCRGHPAVTPDRRGITAEKGEPRKVELVSKLITHGVSLALLSAILSCGFLLGNDLSDAEDYC
jgi:hypothetical protein